MNKLKNWFNDPKNRRYVYNVLVALVPLLVLSGVILPDQAGLVVSIIGALLGIGGFGLAQANTPNDSDDSATDV